MESYVGEIRMFAGNFAPVGWAICDGRTLSIAEYPELFSLIGTTYGGDGMITFRLPDLRGRIPIHRGQNPVTGTTYTLGQAGGAEQVMLTVEQLPAHTHPVQATAEAGTSASPENGLWAAAARPYYSEGSPGAVMAEDVVAETGGGQPHPNMMPSLAINFIISLQGLFPAQ